MTAAAVVPIRAPAEEARAVISGLSTELASSGGDLEPLLERFLVSILPLAGAQAGAVRVLGDDGQTMRLVAQSGLPAQVLSAERLMQRDCGMCGIAAGTDVLGWVDDVRACAQHGTGSYFGVQCNSVLAISLPHGNQVLGIYNLFFEATPQIDPATQNILRLIGQLLGLALHNARIERERLRVTVMKERQEMVNEVHDALAQTLAYVRMRLPLLNDAMLAHDDARSIKYFSDVKNAVGEVHDNLREVMTYFRTRMDPLGLLHALQGLARGYQDRTGIALELRNSAQNLNLSDEQEVQVFHIIQEALANIAKHSMAKRALVAIDRTPRQLEFLIEDDGLGMTAPSVSTIVTSAQGMSPPGHFGLEIMQGRAQRLGGSLEVGMKDGGGTRVRLVMPINTKPLGAGV
ncbi:ATP-binding protein [Rhodoferax sp.]|uniref:GAF domain-containing sensor histidine kinase n=1 Tax=Rhodoferax sp. TaxID=50421 RepID=UPI0027721CEC|nr:ATP-binding protein [Rhodoferax sp.]